MKFKKLFNKSNRRKPRANTFVLESLEPRLLLSATPMTAAVVTTDHLDYAPGETAVITTANTNGDGLQFGAGELVRFDVSRTDGMADAASTTAGVGPAGNEAWYVTDGVGGFTAHLGSDVSGDGIADWIAPDNDNTINSSISTSWFVEEQYRNSSLVVTAAGQESGAVATHAFTDAGTNTTTVLTATSATTVYGTRLDFTATVTAAAGTVDPTGSVEFFVDGISLGVETAFSGGAADGVVQFKTNLFAFQLTAGVHSVHAVFTGTAGSFNDSTSANISHQVTQKHITGRFTADLSKVYDGTTVAPGTATLNNVELIDLGNVSLVGAANFDTANVGIKKTVTFTGGVLTGSAAGNYILDSVRGDLADITPATVTVSNYTGVYDGLAHGATILGAPGEDLSGSLIMAKHTNVGTFTEGWTFSNANYVAATGTNTITITKANATIVASGYHSVYDGAAHTATLTATGVLGESLSGLALNATPHSNAGIYSDSWTFTDSTGNYNSTSGSVISSITALGITGSFTVSNKTYDATTAATVQTRTLTGVLAGDLGNVSLIGGTASFNNANVGTGKTVTLTGATLTGAVAGNYSLTSVNTTTADITAKGITGNFTAANKVYDGSTAATVQTRTLAGVIGLDDVSLIGGIATFNNANAGIGKTVTLAGATLSGAAVGNYSLTSVNTTTADIGKANATITLTGYVGIYDGAAHQATGTATGVLGESLSGLNLSVTSHTNAGLYRDIVTFTDVTGNYLNTSKAVRSDIAKANATITLTGYVGIYDGAAHQATGTATGVLGESLSGLNLSVTSHTNAGTYLDAVTFTDVTGNYKNIVKNVSSSIAKATATISLTGYVGIYDGAAHQATGTATGVLGESLSGLNLSVTSHTNAGLYRDIVTFTDVTGNYLNTSKAVRSDIAKANATITLTGYVGIYDGAAHQATGTATGVLGESLSGLNLSVTSHTNAGTYLDAVTFTDVTGNYKNIVKNVSSSIAKATATISLTGYVGIYDGAAHQATGTATGVLGESLSGLNLSVTSHTNAGLYRDIVTFTDVTGNYLNTSKAVRSDIAKANATITLTGYVGIYDGAAHQATGTATGVLGESLSGLNLSVTSHTNAGTYLDAVTFTDVTGNYKNIVKNVSSSIAKATATISLTGYRVTFDGLPHTATGRVIGVNGEDLSAGLDMTSTTHINVGLYRDIVTFTDLTGNYLNASKAVRNDIV